MVQGAVREEQQWDSGYQKKIREVECMWRSCVIGAALGCHVRQDLTTRSSLSLCPVFSFLRYIPTFKNIHTSGSQGTIKRCYRVKKGLYFGPSVFICALQC